MKKLLFMILIGLSMTVMLYAQEQAQEQEKEQKTAAQGQEKNEGSAKYVLNFTNFGVGANLPNNTGGTYLVEGSLELMHFGVEHTGTHLEIAFSPFRAVGWYTGGFSCSFVNVYLAWNVLDLGRFFFAPAASLHYLFMDSDFNFDRYIITAGLDSGISSESGKVKYNVFTLQTGVRIIEGQPKLFAGVKFDFLMSALSSSGFFN